MRNSIITLGVAAVLFASNFVLGTQSGDDIAAFIDTMTTSTQVLKQEATAVGPGAEVEYIFDSGALYGFEQSLKSLTASIQGEVAQLTGHAPFTSTADADKVEKAFGLFASAVQAVLDTMNTNAFVDYIVPLIATNLLGALAVFEEALNQFANELIHVVGSGPDVAYLDKFIEDIDDEIDHTLDVYNGLLVLS